jgi:hypothetical protein
MEDGIESSFLGFVFLVSVKSRIIARKLERKPEIPTETRNYSTAAEEGRL